MIHRLLSCSILQFQLTLCILSNIVIVHLGILYFFDFMYNQIISKTYLMNLVDIIFSFLLQKYPVHDLNPDCTSKNPNLTIIFFHGIAYGSDDDWKQTWTTRPINGKEECICWPQMWIPKDLNDNVKILSLSYDSNVVANVHNDVTEIGRNLIQSLVTDSRCDN